jgi:hypothetical protein
MLKLKTSMKKLFLLTAMLLLAILTKGQQATTAINDLGEVTFKTASEIKQEEAFKKIFIENYIKNFYENKNRAAAPPCSTYIIPVVFHVYGPEGPTGTVMQNGSPVNLAVIQSALDETNKDFNGLNTDYSSVHNLFQSRRGTLNIEFKLAQIDPNGNPTTGVVIHTIDASYAPNNTSATIPAVAADAWDNFKYVNIYVQKDWQGLGTLNLSGIAWPPDVTMSNNKMARICYNGRYLGNNCGLPSNGANSDFTGVFTHEFGHFFDLKHLFTDNLCYDATVNDIDLVSDTPNSFNGEGCHASPTSQYPNCPFPPGPGMPQGTSTANCLSNTENYMTYNNCYKMFTVGQAARMISALNHPARTTLWQPSNLIATGVACATVATGFAQQKNVISNLEVYPNPSNGEFNFKLNANKGIYNIEINDISGKIVYSNELNNISGEVNTKFYLNNIERGIYFLTVQKDNLKKTIKIIIQ